MEKQFNLQMTLNLVGMIAVALLIIFFFRNALGSMSMLFGAVVILAAVGFFGWLFIDHVH